VCRELNRASAATTEGLDGVSVNTFSDKKEEEEVEKNIIHAHKDRRQFITSTIGGVVGRTRAFTTV